MEATPGAGDRFLVLKWQWIQLILSQTKTMEIRGVAFRRGRYFLGFKSNVYGCVELGDPMRIASGAEWAAFRHFHRVEARELPYRKTFGCPILRAQALSKPIPFIHPKGAVGIVKYR